VAPRRGQGGRLAAAFVAALGLLVGAFAWSASSDLRPTDVWRDRDGEPVSAATVSSYAGPEHCDWQTVTFLELQAGSGLTEPALSGRVTFLRDPDGTLADYVVSPYAAPVARPDDAVDTGWERDGQEVWLDREGWAAYVRIDGEAYERWPRTSGPIACA
jgi:hypothetical protein